MDVVTPGMILVTWVWLYTLIPKSGMLSEKEVHATKLKMKKRIQTFVEDHHLIGKQHFIYCNNH